MRMFIIKILMRLLGDNSYKQVNDKIMKEWLLSLAQENSGYKGYYSIRKKAILNVMGIGIEQKEYWVNIGRLAELKHLNNLSLELLKSQDKTHAIKKRTEQEDNK